MNVDFDGLRKNLANATHKAIDILNSNYDSDPDSNCITIESDDLERLSDAMEQIRMAALVLCHSTAENECWGEIETDIINTEFPEE